jgi:(1->4)-alpha-D-glucan 1-alpha-D-glucosylmutase
MRATYRVQLRKEFGFSDAAAIADYLSDLGVSHLYSSPYLQAATGSSHGYDVVDHSRVNAELGGEDAHAAMCATLGAAGLGQVLDIVPNHMAIGGRENVWWWDILENGQASRFASYFDVEWDPPEARLRNTILLPVLGDRYGRVLEAGDLRLQRTGARFEICYFDDVFPVRPRSLVGLLERAAERCGSAELGFIADALEALPRTTAADRPSITRRHRDKEVLLGHLERLTLDNSLVARTIDSVVAELNRDHDALDALLLDQNYRLAFWRTAQRDLGYRRFFDVNSLVGLRAELEEVFEGTHHLVLDWIRRGVIDGLRIDHPDGLRDPEQYLERLRQAAPDGWLVVEKILERDERLRKSWPVDGTTGYEYLNRVGRLFVDPDGEQPLTELYARFTGESIDVADIIRQSKLLVLREILGSDLGRLTAVLVDICEQHRAYRDYTRAELYDTLRELIINLPVYRTYVRAEANEVQADDVRYVTEAAERAIASRPELDADLLYFLRDVLLLRDPGDLERELAMRVQQLSGAVIAKGVEDTAFYVHNRLLSLNEVGGALDQFSLSVEDYHRACLETQQRWPATMLTTSTHDTKRGEDVRARITVLAQIPSRWSDAVHRWSALNDRYRRGDVPDRNMEYMIYQTLVGAWPIDGQRLTEYLGKAAREAKRQTSWTAPNPEYEAGLLEFAARILDDPEFVDDLVQFLETILEPARITSLAQTLLKLTAPGIPDIYQGTELWDLSLVDPDNRRPVDYEIRRQLLAQLECATPERIWSKADSGLPKLWVIRQALAVRRDHPDSFGPRGQYEPLYARGARSGHVVAARRGDDVAVVVPRLTIRLDGDWADTSLDVPGDGWRNVLTGDELDGGNMSVGDLLRRFPVALLERPADAA